MERLTKPETVTTNDLDVQIKRVFEEGTRTEVEVSVTNRAPSGEGSNRPEIHRVELVLPGSRTRWTAEELRPLERYALLATVVNRGAVFAGRIPAGITAVDLFIVAAPDGGAEPTSITIPLAIAP
jgi:hypothetical protein